MHTGQVKGWQMWEVEFTMIPMLVLGFLRPQTIGKVRTGTGRAGAQGLLT